ncbi:hypothetical protein DFH01_24370 [Falsiroseomonas bella]|uniref:Uncharacterized protein n=1 Tax=Falsiroseomonas bella TaxID=2184016 RepID=A0A317FAP7_9PROT|nr:hypothetical protein [Falsiroseomonas bella]PWS34666.1 hypothetical protein DFH01_24370 [Falsiroseomonas bella]
MNFRKLLADRRLWIAAGAVAFLLVARASGLGEVLSLDTLARNREALSDFVAAHFALAALAYVGIYAAAVAFSFPGALFLTLRGTPPPIPMRRWMRCLAATCAIMPMA